MDEKNELEIVNEEFYKFNVEGTIEYIDESIKPSPSLKVSSKTVIKEVK